jgi:hypothetical protein
VTEISWRTSKDAYPPGLKISGKDFAQVRLRRDKFHSEWNYEIHPASLKH